MERRHALWRRLGLPTVALLVLAGIALVCVLDVLTGTDVRIFPLYFLPLALAAKRLGVAGALAASVVAALAWLLAQYLSGRQYPGAAYWVVNFFTQGSAFVVVALLVARLELRLQRERELSRTDALTGLLNSRAFHEAGAETLRVALRRGEPVTLACVDLDRFKQVNDTQGHDAGDRLLALIAGLLRNAVGARGLVARVGGDEFAVLLPGHGAAAAAAVLESARTALLDSAEVRATGVSASIGAVSHVPGAPSLDELMRQADALMYRVKQDGRNGVRVVEAGGG